MKLIRKVTAILATIVLLGLLPAAAAHGNDHGDMTPGMDMSAASHSSPNVSSSSTSNNVSGRGSYFQLREHSGWILAHIVVLTTAWVFILPVATMLSISRSRYRLLVQLVFLCLNGVGVLLVSIYNDITPDLYPKNAHHRLGWLLTCVVSAQVILGIVTAYAGHRSTRIQPEERATLTPVSAEAMAEHQRMHNLRFAETYRFSNDSGQGTEPNTESLRSHSISSAGENDEQRHGLCRMEEDAGEDEENGREKQGLIYGSKVDQLLSRRLRGLLSSRILRTLQSIIDVVDRLILLLGFVALATGLVTYCGLFMGGEVFSGLAHFIKGGIFFWYGILTLGRWAGSFADIGWAWNIKPPRTIVGGQHANRPSAEFVESCLFFLYGSTNVFLEHLAAWGGEWSAEDLEHISIALMLFGGGLCGMLIESKAVRNLLNATIEPWRFNGADEQAILQPPKTYGFPMNPVPALIVLLLGMMMSSHHQESMLSTMIHKQWGTLLVGAALSRCATYIIFYISPPASILPGRPPSELITAFCLMAGGILFMASSKDTVTSMELYHLDAMVVFTVSMGVITFLMAWIILVIAIKGWSVTKKERLAKTHQPEA